jgi:hypothetical protein
METVSERVFKQPGKSYERVIANRVSGLKNPTFVLLATQLQSLDFYDEHFTLLDKNYLSPVATGSTRNYVFHIVDTNYLDADTLFILSFKPRRDKHFDGLRGLLYVNTNGYAIQSVIAEPADDSRTRIHIQQNYERVQGRWFPTQLNTDFELQDVAVNGARMLLVGRTYLQDIEIEPELRGRDFGSVALEVDPRAGKRDSIIANYRPDSLSDKERNTYAFIDSVGEAEHFDRRLSGLQALLTGKIRFGPVSWDYTRLIAYNTQLGWRVGSGLETSTLVSRRFTLGGNVRYDFGARILEYDGYVRFLLWPRHELELQVDYTKRFGTAGQATFHNERTNPVDELLLNAVLPDEVLTAGWNASARFRVVKYLTGRLQVSRGWHHNLGTYFFRQQLGDVTVGRNMLWHSTVTASLKYAFKEKVVRTATETYSLDTKFPVFWFNIERSVPGLWDSQLDYWRLTAQASKSFLLKKLGTTSLALTAGSVVGEAPYYKNFYATGSRQRLSYIWVEQAFNTMPTNTFLSDAFVSTRVVHDFGQLIFGKGKHAPGVKLTTSAIVGRMRHADVHDGLEYKTPEKGYFESGVILDRILRMRYFNALSIGLGLGVFYRYGAYWESPWWQNGALRLTLSAGL